MTERDPKRTTRQYSRMVGLAFLAFIVIVSIRIINRGQESISGLAQGASAPKFAAPSASGRLTGYANIFQTHADARRAGRNEAACEVSDKDAIRVCDYFNRRPLVMVVWSTKCGGCDAQVTVADALSRRYPNINFLGLALVDSVAAVRARSNERGWRIPIAVDQDGRVGALYKIGVPPATFFILPKGTVFHTALGRLDTNVIAADVRKLLRESRREAALGR